MDEDIRGMRIRAAAIMAKDGELFCGPDHAYILRHADPPGGLKGCEQGFVTECARFVRRKPALRIAKQAGQTKIILSAPHIGLFSEDLKSTNFTV